MFVVKGPSASAKMFVFRVDATQKLSVGTEPVEVDEQVAACYIESGHLEQVDPPTKAASTKTANAKT